MHHSGRLSESASNTSAPNECLKKIQYHGEYHEYCGGYLEYHGDVQYHGDIMMHVGDYHEYCGGVQYHGGYHEYHGGYHDACGGYHEYHGVMIPLKWRNSSSILSTSHFMIAILVSAFEIQ